jgi:hypothetical protein
MEIIEKLVIGMYVRDNGEMFPILVRSENGEPVFSSGVPKSGTFLPFPQPTFEVSAVLSNGLPVTIGYKIPGNSEINWEQLADDAENRYQDKRTEADRAKKAAKA